MSVINAVALLAAAGGDYQISRSVRFRSSASAYFNRTPSSAGSQTTWTWSGWVKRGYVGANQGTLFFGDSTTTNYGGVYFTGDNLYFDNRPTAGLNARLTTTQVFRDPSAWYHIVAVWDTTNATSGDRLRLYVNGVRVTTFSTATYPAQNTTSVVNAAIAHEHGCTNVASSGVNNFFDGYLTEVNFIDGQALTPSSFGETDAATGVWKPKKYAGTYGTNGFYLNFSDNSNNTAATIGKDSSGNGNNWTPNNISVTAGSTYDSMLDVPTPWADGGNGRGNYAVLNPLKTTAAPNQGNLAFLGTSGSFVDSVYGSIGVTGSGKYYFEVNGGYIVGVNASDTNPSTNQTNGRVVYHGAVGAIYDGASAVQSGLATVTSTDVVGVALNLDAGTLAFYKNNVQVGTNVTIFASNIWWPFLQNTNTYTSFANFGQRPFAYTPPTGFKALNTQNLPDSTIKKGNAYFDVVTRNGFGSSGGSITSLQFQPDFMWEKQRNGVSNHYLVDAVRGVSKYLNSDATAAEGTLATYVTSFNSNGYTMGSSDFATTATMVDYVWKESVTAGFDIVTYTGDSNASRTVSHGLGVTPSLVIIKNRTTARSWPVRHSALIAANNLYLESTSASTAISGTQYGGVGTLTSSTFGFVSGSVNISNVNSSANDYVAYLFAEVAGFSKFGSYTGNGSTDGPFVFCGFRPRYVLTKSATGLESWYINDSSMNPYNVTTSILAANTSAAEVTGSWIDILSNGFKIRYNASPFNTSGGTYIFMAFAENPFKNSLAR